MCCPNAQIKKYIDSRRDLDGSIYLAPNLTIIAPGFLQTEWWQISRPVYVRDRDLEVEILFELHTNQTMPVTFRPQFANDKQVYTQRNLKRKHVKW